MSLVLYTDGGCSGNAGAMPQRRMRWVVADSAGTIVSKGCGPGGSNNIAEFQAILVAVQWVKITGLRSVDIFTDSKNNLSWAGQRRPGLKINDRARVLRMQRDLAALHIPFTLTWIPRAQNLAGHYLETWRG